MQIWQQVGFLLLLSAVLFGLAIWIASRVRRSPRDRERCRRMTVNQYGRLGDAIITEVIDDVLYYSYSIGGVVYTASQHVAQLKEVLPEDPGRLIGPVTIKYTPRNPANSIIVCENWSGIRTGSRPRMTYKGTQ